MDFVFDSLEFVCCLHDVLLFLIQIKEEWMHNVFVITNADREDPDWISHNVAFHQDLHCY